MSELYFPFAFPVFASGLKWSFRVKQSRCDANTWPKLDTCYACNGSSALEHWRQAGSEWKRFAIYQFYHTLLGLGLWAPRRVGAFLFLNGKYLWYKIYSWFLLFNVLKNANNNIYKYILDLNEYIRLFLLVYLNLIAFKYNFKRYYKKNIYIYYYPPTSASTMLKLKITLLH